MGFFTNTKVLLLMDFSNQIIKAQSVNGDLSFGGKNTGGVYGFINQFCKQVEVHKPDRVIVCCDKRPYLREQFWSEYKANRKNDDPSFYEKVSENKKYCKEFLDIVNVPMWKVEGFEADDLFAIACNRHSSDFGKIIIVSSDDDLIQLFNHSNVMLQRSKDTYGLDQFKEEYPDIALEDWIKIVALYGGHNNVKGVKGIGLKTALKIIREGRWEEVYSKNKEVLDRCLKLVKIPFTDDAPETPLVAHRYNERAMLKFMSPLGITLRQHHRDAFALVEREY